MIRAWLNWKTVLALAAIIIVAGTIVYSRYLTGKIAADERKKVDAWVEAQRTILSATDQTSLNLASKISTENVDIPIIETDEKDSITNNYLNLDSNSIRNNPQYLRRTLASFKALHAPIVMVVSQQPYQANKYYYGRSVLQQEIQYYPLVQLIIISLFIVITLLLIRTSHKSSQNQLWVGMAKETAHQLGTPVSSLQGWVEVLKDENGNEAIATEIEKDVTRLQLISDRFGKIGSQPSLEKKELLGQVTHMVNYMRKKAGAGIRFQLDFENRETVHAMLSAPLFDWVIENLIKNALDAMEGKGSLHVHVHAAHSHVIIDITDSGKGIPAKNLSKVFNPGFTTKKRGWGLGLTLTKRIIEQYHQGQIFVKWSEPGKGTTFRIVLPALVD
ncbi:sensor histidine kinase [Deminuibacter soli]|uniref:histidine kinase n=1 Tax=Deminuibacter soli TaxID=2291815 RepID=A0A3E1NLP3_9BACT|nr:ATP-binding protein [Deminuibacter soli]RFM28860.1 GHKL domain-containing protein [Deminuibacter soli]